MSYPRPSAFISGPIAFFSILLDLVLAFGPRTGDPRLANVAEARPVLAAIPMETIFTDQQKIRAPAPVSNPAITFGPGRQFSLSPETVISDRHGHYYEYPQSVLIMWKAARPDYAGYGQIEIAEVMGPHQVEGNRLWFGKSFYDS